MRRIRKIAAMILSLSAIFCISAGAVAPSTNYLKDTIDNEGNTVRRIVFSNMSSLGDFSDIELGKQHLQALGFEDDWIAGLPDAEIAKYADISEATVVTSYLKLRDLTKEEKQEKAGYEAENGVGTYEDPREFEVISAEEFNAAQIAPIDDGSFSIDDGYVKLTITCNKRLSEKDQYMVSGRYEWTTMPKTRGKDCFVVSTNNLNIKPDTFYSITKSSCDYYLHVASVGGVSRSKLKDKSYIDQVDSESSGNGGWEYSGTGGYGLDHTFRTDNPPPRTMVSGTTATSRYYKNYKGYISFDGAVTLPNQATNFNAFATLHHNIKAYSGSISVGIPKSAGVSIAPADKYKTKQIASYISYKP